MITSRLRVDSTHPIAQLRAALAKLARNAFESAAASDVLGPCDEAIDDRAGVCSVDAEHIVFENRVSPR